MVLKEDCVNFTRVRKDIPNLGTQEAKILMMPKCKIGKMALGGCAEDCSAYEKTEE